MTVETLDAFVTLKPRRLKRSLSLPHTFLATGSSRGGTSMVGFLLSQLGVHMGTHDGSVVHEDLAIINNIEDKAQLEAHIARRNKGHRVWGFKAPSAAFELDWFDKALRNPILIVVLRNPLAVSRSIVSRHPVYGDGENGHIEGIAHALRHYEAVTTSLQSLSAPTLLIDYEAAISRPEVFLREFCDTLALAPDDNTFSKALEGISGSDYTRKL